MISEDRVVPTTDALQVQVPKAAEIVAESIRRRIIRGDIGENEALPPETELMEIFGVSRPTLREALRVLEAESLIRVRRGARGGARAQKMSADLVSRYAGMLLQSRGTTVGDVYEAQLTFEPACVRKLAMTRTEETLAALRESLVEERAAVKDGTATFTRIEFHHRLIQLSGNQTLLLLSEQITYVLTEAAVLAYPIGLDAERAFADHESLVGLIAERDGDGAHDLWQKHLQDAGERVFDQLGGDRRVIDLFE